MSCATLSRSRGAAVETATNSLRPRAMQLITVPRGATGMLTIPRYESHECRATTARGELFGNPELLPPNVVGGKNAQAFSAAHVKATLVGKIVSGTAYSSAEVYASGIVTLPLQRVKALDRLHALNRALGDYSGTLRKQSQRPAAFVALEPMPGNSFDPTNTSVCWH